jgi:hydrogenase maturation protease
MAMMGRTTYNRSECLIMGCGNTLREDDGVGPWMADWAQEHFRNMPGVKVVNRDHWMAELALDVAEADTAIFVDCSTELRPGQVEIVLIQAVDGRYILDSRRLGAAELLLLAEQLWGATPRTSVLLAIGAGSLDYREGLSDAVTRALPEACRRLEQAVMLHLNRRHSRIA